MKVAYPVYSSEWQWVAFEPRKCEPFRSTWKGGGRATVLVSYDGTVNDICDAVEDLTDQQICCMQISESPTAPGLVGYMLGNGDPIYDAVCDGEVLKPVFGERQM